MWFDYLTHEAVTTSEEAAKVRPDKYSLEQGTKALIVRIKEPGKNKRFVMLVIPGDKVFNEKVAKNVLNTKDIRFAFEDEVSTITDGVKIGGIPPFGNLFNLEVFLDTSVLNNETIIFNAGDRKVSIAVKTSDYVKIVEPTIVSIT